MWWRTDNSWTASRYTKAIFRLQDHSSPRPFWYLMFIAMIPFLKILLQIDFHSFPRLLLLCFILAMTSSEEKSRTFCWIDHGHSTRRKLKLYEKNQWRKKWYEMYGNGVCQKEYWRSSKHLEKGSLTWRQQQWTFSICPWHKMLYLVET